MKYTSLFCLVFFVLVRICSAQIIFTSDELIASFSQQSSQSNFIPASLDGLQALIDKSGSAQTWDFTGIQWQKDPNGNNSTLTLLDYPGGAALANDPDFDSSTHVIKEVSAVPGDPITYEFLKIDANGFWVLGETQDSASVGSKILSFNPGL